MTVTTEMPVRAVLPRLVDIYRRAGFDLAVGLNPAHFSGAPTVAFTWFFKDGRSYTEGLGIAAQEIYFLECLVEAINPGRIFVIGNSTGWSAIALALMAPKARVVTMDGCFDGNSAAGLEFTNRVAAAEGLTLAALRGVSPEDVCTVAQRGGLDGFDLVFVDGRHANENMIRDYQACQALASAACVYVFHDVHSFNLYDGFHRITSQCGWVGRILMGTTSGIGILYDSRALPRLDLVCDAFGPSDQALAYAADQGFRFRHPRLWRWRQSLRKRLGTLQRW